MRQVELIADYACVTGENPLWHPMEQRLYWLDIPRGRLFRFDPATGKHQQCHEGGQVGGFTIQADRSLLLFGDRGAIRVWREGVVRTIVEEIAEERGSRFNDVIADPAGREFCGTMPKPDGTPGSLYRLGLDGTLECLFGGIGCSNGMGFTPDRKRMYFTDSKPREVYVYHVVDNAWSMKEFGHQAVVWQTAVMPAVAIEPGTSQAPAMTRVAARPRMRRGRGGRFCRFLESPPARRYRTLTSDVSVNITPTKSRTWARSSARSQSGVRRRSTSRTKRRCGGPECKLLGQRRSCAQPLDEEPPGSPGHGWDGWRPSDGASQWGLRPPFSLSMST